MKAGNAIEVKHISKSFKIYMDKGQTFKEKMIFKKRRRYEERHVIQDISFSVKKGEAIGLIGHNGCGKSTTLKMLTKIMYPDSGTIEMEGRVSSLIELGAGFHPDMSGRENIYINASIFGLTNKEIDDRLDDIIAFSELEEFIDNPVRTYSSGMYMRLAFAVAINVDADILLIDEILAVGDAAFQAKCFNKLREIKGKGTTIVIVSHSLDQIEQICERSIWIHEGLIEKEDIPSRVHSDYMEYMGRRTKEHEAKYKKDKAKEEEERKEAERKAAEEAKRKADEEAQRVADEKERVRLEEEERIKKEAELKKKQIVLVKKVFLRDAENGEIDNIAAGESVELVIQYEADEEQIEPALMGLMIIRNDGVVAYGVNSKIDHISDIGLKGKGEIVIRFEKMNLIAGEYWIDIAFRKLDMLPYVYVNEATRFTVYNEIPEIGFAKLDHEWML